MFPEDKAKPVHTSSTEKEPIFTLKYYSEANNIRSEAIQLYEYVHDLRGYDEI